MRLKFVIAILFIAVVFVVAIFLLKQNAIVSKPVVAPPTTVAVAPVSNAVPVPAPVAVKKNLTPEEREAAIDAEKDKLDEWSMNSDSQSLSNILGDLTSPEKEIREAAIEATKQFGDTNAIPVLKAMAANTSDNQEAIEMLQAADFIALPEAPLTRHSDTPPTPEQQQRQARAQARQAQIHAQHTGQQNSGTNSVP